MDTLKRYDLHKDDYSKLHFEINDTASYFETHKTHATVPHRHSFYQIIWFKTKGSHYVDYQIIEHEANTLFFINKNQVHYFCDDSVNEGFLFHFNDHFINRNGVDPMDRFATTIFNEIGNAHIILSENEAKKISLITSFIESEILFKDAYYKEQVFHYFQTILFQIERLRKQQNAIDHTNDADYRLASSFKAHIVKHMERFLSVDDYATALGTNAKTLTEVSKQYLGDTPAHVIRDSKLLEAKRMLSNQKLSVKEIAYGLGFQDPTYFTKYFKKGTGLTPKAFQKAYL